MRKTASFLLAVLLLTGLVLSVSAAETIDPNRKCSLTVMMKWNSEPLDSGFLTLYRVGEITSAEGNDFFIPVPELKDSGISLQELSDTQLPQKLEYLAVQTKLDPLRAGIHNGKAIWDPLQTGLYVVTQVEADACNGLEPIQPFLISLPHWDGSHYIYHREAQPKVEPEKAPEESTEPEPSQPREPSLPQTGRLNWLVPVLAVSGLLLLLCGILLCTGKKVDREA